MRRQWQTSLLNRQMAPPLVYHVDPEQVGEMVRKSWVQLHLDDETREFVHACEPSALKDGMATFLRSFMSRTDANGIVGRGRMFVLSKEQFQKLVPEVSCDTSDSLSLLDIGSGDGSITLRYASHFKRIVTTETSTVMARILRGRGWECIVPPDEQLPEEQFDVITCFNVLDRADKPLSLLEDLKKRLKPDSGRLILAVVLPWCPFVESGTEQVPPTEKLAMQGCACRDGASFEKSLGALVEREITRLGFDIVSVSRVPYISEGDQKQPYYVLSDSVIVCKVSGSGSIQQTSSEGNL